MNQTGHQSSHDTDDYDFHDAQNQALEYTGRHQRQERRAEQYTDPEGVQQQGANDFCHQNGTQNTGHGLFFGQEQTVNETNNGSGDGEAGEVRRNGEQCRTDEVTNAPTRAACQGPRYSAANTTGTKAKPILMFHAAMDKKRDKMTFSATSMAIMTSCLVVNFLFSDIIKPPCYLQIKQHAKQQFSRRKPQKPFPGDTKKHEISNKTGEISCLCARWDASMQIPPF